ncbi:galactose mutarotase [Gangjinia marincola]|uniref:Aldose 1-epimerase n=1 Tax=Gangjinia marincola TaxID=578463 RepID=A0ABP3XVB2_9FLAO
MAFSIEKFIQNTENKLVDVFTLYNSNGLTATFTNYGQRLIELLTPDRYGIFKTIVLRYNTLEEYLNQEEKYLGAVIGQYANRIANGEFQLDDQEIVLDKNNQGNHLHGGEHGFHNTVWEVIDHGKNWIEFATEFPEDLNAYPGTLNVKTRYTLTDENELIIQYSATSDKTTIVNLTHHSYFNLSLDTNNSILAHELQIKADNFTPIKDNLIPTGELRSVENTPFDFRNFTAIGKRINNQEEQLRYAGGYDHNYVLNSNKSNAKSLVHAASSRAKDSGRTLDVFTDKPGMQLYTGNFLENSRGNSIHKNRTGFCLETQYYPDSPNHPNFPSPVLQTDQKYGSTTIYKFGITE